MNYTYTALYNNCHTSFYGEEVSFHCHWYTTEQGRCEIAFIRTQQNRADSGEPESDAVSETIVKLIFLKMTTFLTVNILIKHYFPPVLKNTCYKGTKKELHCK